MKKNNVKRPILAENIYLTKSEKNILNFVNSFEDSEFNLSQTELAKLANSSEAAVSRFVRKYNFKDYRNFIASINVKISNFQRMYPIKYDEGKEPNPFSVIYSSYKYAIESIDEENVTDNCIKAAELINNSRNILIYGSGSSQRRSLDLVANLIKIGKSVVYNSDFHIFFPALANASSEDALIVFSNNLKSTESHFVISNAHKNGLKIIAITSKHDNKINKNLDVIIQYQKIQNDTLLVPVSSRVSQMLIGNILFEAIIYNNSENYNKLKKSSALIDEWSNIDKIHHKV
ncbi:MurR/RpiR family transcriptional regulator [Mycoplasma bovis]|uniref:MurR/RpiR family transcriptional regulator n=1 Tax=Mycoplasmopsis bovis TaxID=28903 RepID=UPI001771C21E|nr:MurR/RpiR family transcriptional regulator [Mycoplasmopsis bovis]MBT1345610.1 MurR/RpiR family transcriptional regulator [Mycoplasmopsis bovis]MBT1355823.1 MurR/RpiR family transcriptional regulator [Mycoplasmopsis bovis]MBT1386455.1 MurR/RpiR family transcriptional regulator [Mycoplasmopsis bovis]MBT1395631.1 MurR/RpiR family transcriptional regulator [Mycoplasmopsis bovis]MBT1418743.1 MurR/RpiR family transcriptional regulator [Mycoplasmopsis bovis]